MSMYSHSYSVPNISVMEANQVSNNKRQEIMALWNFFTLKKKVICFILSKSIHIERQISYVFSHTSLLDFIQIPKIMSIYLTLE